MKLEFYTFLPSVLAFLCGLFFTAILFYKQNKVILISRLGIWIVWTFLLFSMLGLIAIKMSSLTVSYFVVLSGFFLLGCLYLVLAPVTLGWWSRKTLKDVLIGLIMFYFFGLSGFILIYNLLSEQYTYFLYLMLGATPAFLLPALAVTSYDYWMLIPQIQYKTWTYPLHKPVPRLIPVDTIKVVMNFTPSPEQGNKSFEGYEVEYPGNVSLGELFHYFISFHNKHREYRKKPIEFMTGNQIPLKWVLYKISPSKKKVYLNTDKTLLENAIEMNDIIYASSSNQ